MDKGVRTCMIPGTLLCIFSRSGNIFAEKHKQLIIDKTVFLS